MGQALAHRELGEALLVLGHAGQHFGRRRQRHVLDLRQLFVDCLAVVVATVALVEQGGQRGDVFQQLGCPFLHVYRCTITLQLQARTATFLDHAQEVG